MKQKKINTVCVFLVFAAGMIFATGSKDGVSSQSSGWPAQPVQFLVGANPGGGIDTAARLMAKHLEKELKQTIVVSNVSGGAGSIAARQVKAAKPDGYTALVAHEALLTNKISGITEFDYDGFSAGGIALKVYSTSLLSKKYKTFDELIAAARANPGKIKFGTEIATNDTAIIALMENNLGIRFQIVDSGAVSDQIASMMGGHIDFMKAPVGLAKDYVDTGTFHILGFFNEKRNPAYPNTPTMKEHGIDFVVDKFFYCGFPLTTPANVIEKFSMALKAVSEKADFIKDAGNIQYTVEYIEPINIPTYFEQCKIRLTEYQKLLDNRK